MFYWIVPQLPGQPPLRAYPLAGHTGRTEDRNHLTNTGTTLTTASVRLPMWNMPHHAEHHRYRSVASPRRTGRSGPTWHIRGQGMHAGITDLLRSPPRTGRRLTPAAE